MKQNRFWILGSACAGKSTGARALAAEVGGEVVDVDGRLYGDYFSRYDPASTPALHKQFHNPNPLAWALSLPWPDYNAHTRQADGELLELLLAELDQVPQRPLIIDGGFSHPAILAAQIPAHQIVCLTIPDALRVQIWEKAPDRQEMRDWIGALPDPTRKWRTFLQFDQQIDRQMRREAQEAGIPILQRTEETTVQALTTQVRALFHL
jgi:hypothetical protein